VLLVLASLVLGFSFENGLPSAFAMIAVIVLFGLALATFSAWVGLTIGDPETVQAAVFVPLLPLVFTSSAFAPISALPGWMQPIARVNPITAAIDFARGLALGNETLLRVSHISLGTAAWHFTVWWLGIVVTFTTLAVRRYRKG
jgi:ABC-2 type transport system permease protein/oleandomycin transport system permease protein